MQQSIDDLAERVSRSPRPSLAPPDVASVPITQSSDGEVSAALSRRWAQVASTSGSSDDDTTEHEQRVPLTGGSRA